MRRALAAWIVSLLGCSEHHAVVVDGGVHDAGTRTPYLLCDGSGDVRLGVGHQAGYLSSTRPFTNPYGHSFLYVLGDCTYLAGESLLGFMVEGTLSEAEATEVAKRFQIDALAGGPVDGNEAGDDCDKVWVATQSDFEWCSCGCRVLSPALEAAKTGTGPWLEAGESLTGDVEVGAVRSIMHPEHTYQPWPFEIDLAVLATDDLDGPVPVEVVSGDHADALRTLRAIDPDRYDDEPVYVEHEGAYYEVYVLDIVPERFRAAIERFASVPQGPPP